jgi:hypothetical protein
MLVQNEEGEFYRITKFDSSSAIAKVESDMQRILQTEWKVKLVMQSILTSEYTVGLGKEELTVYISHNKAPLDRITLNCYSGNIATPEHLRLSLHVSEASPVVPVFKKLFK